MPLTQKQAIATVLRHAGREGFHVTKIAALLEERKLWSWKNVKRPEDSIRSIIRKDPENLFVKVAMATFALREETQLGHELQMSTRRQTAREEGEVEEEDEDLEPLLVGEVVWAKLSSSPWWPAQVEVPQEKHKRLQHKESDVFVVFFGDNQCQWLPRDKLEPWMCPEYSERIKTKNTSVREAIREALLGIQAMNSSPSISESEQVRSSSSNSSSRRRRSKQFGEQLMHASTEFQHAVASGAKRPRDTSGRNPKKIKVSECSRRRSLTSNAQDRRIPLFGGVGAAQETGDVNQSKEERVAKSIEVDAHEMECFHCRVKETPRWHVFQGVVSCHACALERESSKEFVDRLGKTPPPSLEEKKNRSSSERDSESKSLFSDLTVITLTDFTMAELKAIADAENKRIGISSCIV